MPSYVIVSLLVTAMLTLACLTGGGVVIQGTVTWALHEYTPPSSCSTGEKTRERVVMLSFVAVSVVPTLSRPPVSTCEPLG